MGMWDLQPYDNDSAADFFAGFMETTQLREEWLKNATNVLEDGGVSQMRALTWVFIQLGHIYVWPISDYDSDLELAIRLAEQVKKSPELNEVEELSLMIENEYQELISRRPPSP